VYTVLTFTICLIVCVILINFTVIGDIMKSFFSAIAPITWGLIIAYVMNPIMMWSEKYIKKVTEKKKPMPKLTRIISTFFTMVVFIAMLSTLCAIILPQVIESITKIFNNIGTYINNLEKWVNSLLVEHPDLVKEIDNQFKNIEATITEFINNIVPKIGDVMVKITDSALSFIMALKDFLIGIIVAVYFLFDKEHFQAQIKKIISAIMPKRAASGLLRICTQTNSSISGFISGKVIDSIIIGLLCFVCMTIMKIDFTVLISVIVGVTNIIPFFGPLIGAVPSALLLLMSSPKQVIPFVILIFIIQQLDGNIIGPKILGQSTGVSAFWVLFSILVGGGLFGFAGMILGVPVFAVIYSLINQYINYMLESKSMSVVTKDYAPAITEPPDPLKKQTKKNKKK
ncbi:MAG: AI-2E family transporter, partial [Ruminococcus sp.]|nr:AI-2E family transporter [Ruminococcus sp.]